MRRGLWFVAGAGAGIYAMVRGRRAAEALTVDGLKDRLGALEVGARLFREEVAQGRVEKETQLRERLGLVPHGRPELEAGRHRAVPPGGDADPHDDLHDDPQDSSDDHGSESHAHHEEGSI